MKDWRKLLIYLIIFIALFLWVWFRERGEAPTEATKKRLDRLLGINLQEVNKFRIEGEGTVIVCAREAAGARWQIQEPFKAEADQEAVSNYLKNIAEREVDRIIKPEEIESLSEFGLDSPKYQLILYTTSGTEYTLQIGTENPNQTAYYAKFKAKGSPLLLLPSYFVKDNIIEKKLSDLRDKTLLAFDKDSVKQIALSFDKSYIRIDRAAIKKEDLWYIQQPLNNVRADSSEVDTILTTLKDTKIDEFVEEAPQELSKYGLDKPKLKVELSLKDKERKCLLVGNKKDDTKVYVKREAAKPVFLVDKKILEDCKKELFELRDKTVLVFERDRVNKIKITTGLQAAELRKYKQDHRIIWRLTYPIKAKADSKQVEDILDALADLKADKFIDSPKSLEIYKLQLPNIIVNLWQEGESAAAPKTLLVGKPAADNSASVYVKNAAENTVYLCRADFQEQLTTDISKLRDRLLLKFNRDILQSLIIKYEDKEILISRKGKYDWQLLKPKKASADNSKVSDILFKLEDLRADRFITDAPMRLSDYGLDNPQLQITLNFKRSRHQQQPPHRTLLFGSRKDNQIYIKLAHRPNIYSHDASLLTDIKKSADELIKK